MMTYYLTLLFLLVELVLDSSSSSFIIYYCFISRGSYYNYYCFSTHIYYKIQHSSDHFFTLGFAVLLPKPPTFWVWNSRFYCVFVDNVAATQTTAHLMPPPLYICVSCFFVILFICIGFVYSAFIYFYASWVKLELYVHKFLPPHLLPMSPWL